ncbi:hypothetical protein PENDEC_c014G05511 [Penicillium decumbens]|uniref:Uncharacterized protein n=1 Tax=Penicillium decumbens TaxID=69771 RepID=A0A1V6P9F4_PENDC|nr:hypothetical protein PENDEC_c014G05511 [Penicillium decumbens]
MATYSKTARETGDFLIEQAYRELEAYNISVQLFMEIIDIANSHEDTELIEIANDNVEYSRRVLLNAIFEAIDYNQYVQYSRDLRAIISLLASQYRLARWSWNVFVDIGSTQTVMNTFLKLLVDATCVTL